MTNVKFLACVRSDRDLHRSSALRYSKSLRATVSALSLGALSALAAQPANAALVSACSGVSLPRSVVTNILGPVITGTINPIQTSVNNILNVVRIIPFVGQTFPPLNLGVAGLLTAAASGAPITLNVLDTSGNIVSPAAQCDTTANSIGLDTPAGIAIGGNKITGLGNNQVAAAADINAIALGNNAGTTAAATGSIAIGNNANASVANSVALGAGSTAVRGANASYAAYGLVAPQASAGEFSVGAAGSARQITNVAAGSAATDAVNVSQLQAVQTRYYSVNSTGGGNVANDGATGVDAIASGKNTTAVGGAAIAVGLNAAATSTNEAAVAIGQGAVANGSSGGVGGAVAIGTGTQATGSGAIAVGTSAAFPTLASGTYSTAIGINAKASATGTVAIGQGAAANNSGTTAIGQGAGGNYTGSFNDVLIGSNAGGQSVATVNTYPDKFTGSVMIGDRAGFNAAPGVYNTFLGYAAGRASKNGALAFGQNVALGGGAFGNGTGDLNVVIGQSGQTLVGSNNTYLGAVATGTATIGNDNIGLGSLAGATSTGSRNIALGSNQGGDYHGDTSVGSADLATRSTGGEVTGDDNIALGTATGANITASRTVALGTGASASANDAIAIGSGARASGISAISIGNGNVVSGLNSGAFGDPNTVSGSGSYAVGNNNTIIANNAFVLGSGVTIAAGLNGAVALGNASTVAAPTAFYTPSLAAIIAGKTPASVVSVGAAGAERQITNVAAGGAPTDAVNVSQLAAVRAASVNAVLYDVDGFGNRTNMITLFGGAPGPVVITNVGPGALSATSTDAVNGSQLFATNTNVTTNTANIAINATNVTNLTTNINNGTIGLVQQTGGAPGNGVITVGAATGGTVVNVAGTSGPRKISGVAAGTAPTDAVNVSQLTTVSTIATNSVQYDLDGLGNRTNNVTLIGGAAGPVGVHNVAAGTLSATSTDAVNGSQLFATNTQVTNNTNNVTNLLNGTAGLVQQTGGAPGNGVITVGAATAGTVVNFTGTGGTRRLVGVSAGVAPTDAVNVSQLTAVGAVAANSVQYNVDGLGNRTNTVTLVGGNTAAPVVINNVAAGALTATSTDAVNGAQLNATNTAVTNNSNALTSLTTNINNGTVGLVQQTGGAPGNGAITVGATTGGTVVNVAGTSGTRTVSGVKAGVATTDAVNVGQLSAASAGAVQYDRNTDGSVNRTSITVGSSGAPANIGNVANGVRAADAVNVGQLQAGLATTLNTANAYTDARVMALSFDLDTVAKRAYAGTASAIALQAPALFAPGQVSMRVGTGLYRGEVAVGASMRATADNGRWSVTGGVSGGRNSGVAASAGVDFIIGN